MRIPLRTTHFPYTTLFRSVAEEEAADDEEGGDEEAAEGHAPGGEQSVPSGAFGPLRGGGRGLSRCPALPGLLPGRLRLRLVAHVVHGLLFRLVRSTAPWCVPLIQDCPIRWRVPVDAARGARTRLVTHMA